VNPARKSILSGTNLLALATGLCALCAVAPAPFTAWVQDAAYPVQIVTAPVRWLVGQVARAGGAGTGASATGDAPLAREVALLTARNLRLAAENDELRAQVRALQRGAELNPQAEAMRIVVPVIAADSPVASGLIMLRTGRVRAADGSEGNVPLGSVAISDAVNIVGRVVRAAGPVADVQPIGQAGTRELRATIFPLEDRADPSADPNADPDADPSAVQLGVVLTPAGQGRLRGSVYALQLADGQFEPAIRTGMTVRLTDPSWPRAAQMLVVGTVEAVSRADNGRPIVTVKPGFDPRSLQQVTILLTPDSTGTLEAPLVTPGAQR